MKFQLFIGLNFCLNLFPDEPQLMITAAPPGNVYAAPGGMYATGYGMPPYGMPPM